MFTARNSFRQIPFKPVYYNNYTEDSSNMYMDGFKN